MAMLQVTAEQMQALEAIAWAGTARHVDADLDLRACDDAGLARALAALPPEGRRAMIGDAVDTARAQGFRTRDEVTALARLFALHGPGVNRGALARRDLDPMERVAVTETLATMPGAALG